MKYSLSDLCKDIDLPKEMVSGVKTADITELNKYIKLLASVETAQEAYESLKSVCEADDDRGCRMLSAQLNSALHSREFYADRGINNQIFIDTMKCFTRFVHEHNDSFDHYGFDRGWWTWRQVSLQIFRLGQLEFETKMQDGKPILSVHIPSDSVMTREALDHSYNHAKIFFKEHGYEYEGFYCNTWLLSPTLKKLLKPGSRILNFMEDYEILSANPEGDDFLRWVYKKAYPDYASLPEDTSLRRDIKKHILNGGKIGNALGRYSKG